MDIRKGEVFASRDVYLDYGSEAITYRWDHHTALIYVCFYDAAECPEPMAYHSRLPNNASHFGREISHEEYEHNFSFR